MEICFDRGLNLPIARLLDANANHGDEHSRKNRYPAHNSQQADSFQRSRDRTDQADDQSNDAKDDSAGSVVCENIHHDRECEDMATHHKDVEYYLCSSKDFSEDWPTQHFSSVCHVVYMRVRKLELSEHVAGVGCEDAQAGDEDYTTAQMSTSESLQLWGIRKVSRYDPDCSQY